MNKTKLWFSVLILIIITLLIAAPISIRPWTEGKEIVIKGHTLFRFPEGKNPQPFDFSNLTIYKNPEHNSCYLFIPEPSIIIRVDDARAYSEPTKIVVNELLNQNLTVTLGIIPRHIEEDKNFSNYIKSIKDNPNVEIAQHGVYHNESDENLTESDILYGYNKIQAILGVRPVTYSAPFNDIDDETIGLLSKYFKGITADWGVLKEGEVAQLGHTVSNYAISQDQNRSMQEIVDRCKTSIARMNYCVILIHPQEFATNMSNASQVSEQKLEELRGVIKDLKGLNATFVNFKDVIECTEANQTYAGGNFSLNNNVTSEELNVSKNEFVDEYNMTED